MRDGGEENRRENLREKVWELKQKNSERTGDVVEAEELNKNEEVWLKQMKMQSK